MGRIRWAVIDEGRNPWNSALALTRQALDSSQRARFLGVLSLVSVEQGEFTWTIKTQTVHKIVAGFFAIFLWTVCVFWAIKLTG